MESGVPFKVYYQDEIRRFVLKADPESPSYAGLVQRIQAVFGIQATAQLRLRWLDAEGDRIAFTSNGELADAVQQLRAVTSQMSSPGAAAVRVYVTAKSADGGFDQSEIRHPGVSCDGCDKSLTGYRFKCLVCPDYDLCATCLNRDIHSQHRMTLIRRPGDAGGFGWGGGCGGGWGGGHHAMRRCLRQQNQPQYQQTQACGNSNDRSCSMRDSGSSACATATASASVGTEQRQLIEHVTSAINTFLEPLGIDASIQVVRDEADAGVQTAQALATQQEVPSADATVKASLLTEARRVDLAHSQASVTQPPPPPRAESGADCSQAQLETSSASFSDDYEIVGKTSSPPLTPQPLPEARIARALEHMTAMGFNDDGGWLTRLLVAKDGDICAVLDAIRPAGGAGTK